MKQNCVKFFGSLSFIALLFLLLMVPGMSGAHEFLVKPVTLRPAPGDTLPFSVVSAHVFMVSQEMEPLNRVEVSLIRGNMTKKIDLKENPVLMTLDGSADLDQDGSYLLCGHRKPMIWTQTTRGWKQGAKKGLDNVVSSGKYEKFCKVLVSAGAPDCQYGKQVGHELEIVPLDDPATLSVGDEGRFKVLYKGEPLSTKVYATYDGFSSHPNTFAYLTSTDGEGVAHVRFFHGGTWMIRAENKNDTGTADYDTHVVRASLIFDLR